MRKLTEPQAHRGRAAVIDGRYPEGMSARCAWCRRVGPVAEGRLVELKPSGAGAVRVFRCAECEDRAKESAA